jgi:alpha-tubulin suppressor-like RCC1 family protein
MTSANTPRDMDGTPRKVPGLSGITTIAAGREVSCAIDGNNALYCWGTSGYGELGPGLSAAAEPTLIASDPVTDVSMGFGHVCARLTTGAVLCWGRNGTGQLGNEESTSEPQALPTRLHWLYGSTP